MIGRSLVVALAITSIFLTNAPRAQADDTARFFGTIIGEVLRDQARQDQQRRQQQQQPATQPRQRGAAPAAPRSVAPAAPRQPDLSRREWMAVQRALAAMGHYHGEIDGLIGPGSRKAIAAWQSSIGASATGYLLAQQAGTLVSLAPPPPSPLVPGPLTGGAEQAQFQQPAGTIGQTGPSFECTAASTPVERAICGSARLAQLDREIAQAYSLAISSLSGEGAQDFTASQRAWIAQRNGCGSNMACLDNVMSQRATMLTQVSAAIHADAAAVGDASHSAALPMPGGQEEIFILTHSHAFPKEWTSKERIADQADLLMKLAIPVIAGTDMEENFISRYLLTEEEVRAAFQAAGAEINPQSFFGTHIIVSAKSGLTVENITSTPFQMDYNEFERIRITDALRQSARAAISRDRRDSGPKRLTLICGIDSRGYDFQHQMFPLGVGTCFAGHQTLNKEIRGVRTRIPIRTNFLPDGVRLDPQQAERLLEAAGGRPRFALAIPVELSVSTEQDEYGRLTIIYAATPTGAMEIRAASDLRTVLHRFSDEELHDITDTPEARKLADFDRPWWIEDRAEEEVILSRVKEIPLDGIGEEDLFSTETGLTVALNMTSRNALEAGMDDLSDFFQSNTGGPVQDLSLALGISTDRIIQAHSSSSRLASGMLIILPQDLASYRLSAQLPLDEAEAEPDSARLWTHLEVKVTHEMLVDFQEGGQRLILAARPDQLVLRRYMPGKSQRDSAEIFRTGFDRGAAAETGQVTLARSSDLLLYGAGLAGTSPEDLFLQHLQARNYAGSDAFAQREAVAELLGSARARATGDNRFWREMRMKLGAYDFGREGWPVESLSGFPQKHTDDAESAIKIELTSRDYFGNLFIPMPPEQAREIQENSSFPNYDLYAAMEVVGLETGFGREIGRVMVLNVRPAELIAFDAGQRRAIFGLGDIRLRHSFDAAPEVDVAVAPPAAADGEFRRAEVQFPIAGVRLGDDFDTTVARVADMIAADHRYTTNTAMRQSRTRNAGAGGRIDDWSSYHNAVLLESSSGNDMIALYHEPPTFAGHVTAISRTRIFDAGSGPTLNDLKASLTRTYPQIETAALEQVAGSGAHFFRMTREGRPGEPVAAEQAACERDGEARVHREMSSLLSQKEVRDTDDTVGRWQDGMSAWLDAQGEYADPGVFPPAPLWLMFGDVPCPDVEVMALAVAVGRDGRIELLRQVTAHPAQIAAIEAQHRAMAGNAIESADLDL